MEVPKIIYEDDALMVLDKPAGWIVNEAKTTKDVPVIQTWIAENFSFPLAKSWEARSGIVHRIDKETSGLLLIAKTESVFRALQEQFKNRVVKKRYIALVHGKLADSCGEIDVPVGRLPWNRERFGVLPGGREAKTSYKVIEEFVKKGEKKNDSETLSLVEVAPLSGRTHQIRIHFKHINHALVGDSFYAGRKTSRRDRMWCPRLFLHASYIEFDHPEKKNRVHFESKLPSDLQKVLSKLK